MWISLVILNLFLLYLPLFFLLKVPCTFNRLLICFLLNGCIAVIAIKYESSFWIPMIICIIVSAALFYIFSKNKSVFFHVVVINLFVILVEYFSLILVQTFSLSIFVHGLLIVVCYCISIFIYNKVINRYQHRLQLSNTSHVLLLLIAIITFAVFYIEVFVPSNNGDLILSTVNLVTLFVYLIIMFVLTTLLLQNIQKQNLLEHRETAQHYFHEYMQGLEEVNRKMYSFQHDYSNILLSLGGYIENKDMDGLKVYFQSTILKTEEQTLLKNQNFKELEKVEIIELKGLLGAKLLKAHSLTISTKVEIPESIKEISIDLMDLARILGIFLDNAIEACLLHSTPSINIALIQLGPKDVLIVIRNNINQENPNIKQLFVESFSTKGMGRGRGLYNVKQI